MARPQNPNASTPYGPELAANVARQLVRGRPLAYSHRVYCGTGFDYHGGQLRHGEIRAYELKPLRTFRDQAAFVRWLARQADASLARREQKDAWYQDTQLIARQRLEQFTT